jgi:hypothetical protein
MMVMLMVMMMMMVMVMMMMMVMVMVMVMTVRIFSPPRLFLLVLQHQGSKWYIEPVPMVTTAFAINRIAYILSFHTELCPHYPITCKWQRRWARQHDAWGRQRLGWNGQGFKV